MSQSNLENKFYSIGEELTNTIYNLKFNKSWDNFDHELSLYALKIVDLVKNFIKCMKDLCNDNHLPKNIIS